jgi:hypothetical protein
LLAIHFSVGLGVNFDAFISYLSFCGFLALYETATYSQALGYKPYKLP